jgi:hypothetical protein
MSLDEPAVTSAGCLYLSRKIVQDKRVNFFPIGRKGASEDFGYCLQARDYNYRVYLDGTVKLKHQIPRVMPAKPWGIDLKTKQYTEFLF